MEFELLRVAYFGGIVNFGRPIYLWRNVEQTTARIYHFYNSNAFKKTREMGNLGTTLFCNFLLNSARKTTNHSPILYINLPTILSFFVHYYCLTLLIIQSYYLWLTVQKRYNSSFIFILQAY